MSAFETLYWLNIAENLRDAALLICIFSTFIYFIVYASYKVCVAEEKPSKKITKIYVVVVSICLLLLILLPNDSTYSHYKYELGEQAAKEQIIDKQ